MKTKEYDLKVILGSETVTLVGPDGKVLKRSGVSELPDFLFDVVHQCLEADIRLCESAKGWIGREKPMTKAADAVLPEYEKG